MSGRKEEKFEEEEYEKEEEEEDKKCPPNLQLSRSNPNEGNKKGRAALVYEEEQKDAKCPPQQVHTHVKQPSMESSDHEKAHQEFAQKDVETIEMEEGLFFAEWEKFNEATDGNVPISNPNERGVKNEARKTTHGSSGGRHAASSPRGTDASSGAEAVDSRAHPPNNAQRRIITLPPTRPGAQRVPGPDYEGPHQDEDEMTFVSREEPTIPILAEAKRVNFEDEEKRRQAAINQGINDFMATAPVADVVPEVFPEVSPDNKGRRRKLVGVFLLVSTIAIVVGAVLGSKGKTLPPTLSPTLSPPPTLSPTGSPLGYEALLSNVSSDGGEALRNSSTPQSMAFNWTVTNSPNLTATNNEAYTNERIIHRYALATLFFSTNGNNWNDRTRWLSEEDECTWYGVNCTSSGAVSELVFYLLGFGNRLTGMLPPEIGLLSDLEELSFWNNKLKGTIPSELWQLTKLTDLEFYENKLTGTIPTEVGMLSDLEGLSFWNNTLDGTMPSELGQLTKLTDLDLYENKFNGIIPTEIGMLSNLEGLWLGSNTLEGTIPIEFWQLTNLTQLGLDENKLNGMIPTKIGMLSNLEGLKLSDNLLEGTIPREVGQLTNLTYLDLRNNYLSGVIPTEIGMLSNLDNLFLYGNNFTGNYTCPDSINYCYISCDSWSNEYTDACRSL